MIKVQNLIHKYKEGTPEETVALADINLEIKKGEFVVVIGHNGSGKSTLAKHLNGLLLPSQGEVLINGMNTKDKDNIWKIRKEIGMVFQNPDNQLVATSVEEDVAFGPENLGVEPALIKERVDEALALVDMVEHKKREPHYLSGGQKQRIAIAGVLAMRPSYIVFDEPTAMLDPKGRKEVVDTILRLNKEEGFTIIHITHYMEEAVNADRLIVMERGKIVKEGTPREIFQEVKLLQDLRMDVPQMTELAYLLKQSDLELPADILTVDEMVKYLC